MEELAPVKVGSQSILLLAWPTSSSFDSLSASYLLEALAQVTPRCEVLASSRMANVFGVCCYTSDTGQAEVAS